MFASLGLPGLSGFVGEFLVFVGTFAYAPVPPRSRPFVMVLGGAYLLWMFQRVVFGDLSEFLQGLGAPPHGHDAASRSLTLAPLVALAVVFGIFPGLSSTSSNSPVNEVAAAVTTASAGARTVVLRMAARLLLGSAACRLPFTCRGRSAARRLGDDRAAEWLAVTRCSS